jgi:hypothetical protein
MATVQLPPPWVTEGRPVIQLPAPLTDGPEVPPRLRWVARACGFLSWAALVREAALDLPAMQQRIEAAVGDTLILNNVRSRRAA